MPLAAPVIPPNALEIPPAPPILAPIPATVLNVADADVILLSAPVPTLLTTLDKSLMPGIELDPVVPLTSVDTAPIPPGKLSTPLATEDKLPVTDDNAPVAADVTEDNAPVAADVTEDNAPVAADVTEDNAPVADVNAPPIPAGNAACAEANSPPTPGNEFASCFAASSLFFLLISARF